jgi:hypothetical protein
MAPPPEDHHHPILHNVFMALGLIVGVLLGGKRPFKAVLTANGLLC